MMKRVVWCALFAALFAAWGGACQGPDEYFRSVGQVSGTGGGVGTGGAQTGGSGPATGGSHVTGSGGVFATGGISGTAGQHGTGGVPATGGAPGTGGRANTGGTTGSGGVLATGGMGGAAGQRGTGGVASGGSGGRGGAAGSGGARATGGAGGSANCVDGIRQTGYARAPAAPCSMCKDNGTDLSAKCMSMVDCLAMHYPCTGNCETNCLNTIGGSGVLSTCVDALVSAACP